MGTVWRTTDTYRRCRVAVKTVTGPAEGVTSEPASRFRRELRVAPLRRNPHIVEMRDAGEAVVGGRPVLCPVTAEILMEPLSRVLTVRRPSPAEAARWGGEICEALAAMHGAGIVHRGLKPANVMIGPDAHVTVLDFGIARLDATGIDPTTLGRTGHVLGRNDAVGGGAPASRCPAGHGQGRPGGRLTALPHALSVITHRAGGSTPDRGQRRACVATGPGRRHAAHGPMRVG
ncbi:protein kinase domain-containing protein [Streptomyces sp. DT224]|uniref:protein kinase domain-containing protein n=1 Tax=Streptomyces sp. DT224 TaxID=3393426 RepID=UPI003CF06646